MICKAVVKFSLSSCQKESEFEFESLLLLYLLNLFMFHYYKMNTLKQRKALEKCLNFFESSYSKNAVGKNGDWFSFLA